MTVCQFALRVESPNADATDEHRGPQGSVAQAEQPTRRDPGARRVAGNQGAGCRPESARVASRERGASGDGRVARAPRKRQREVSSPFEPTKTVRWLHLRLATAC